MDSLKAFVGGTLRAFDPQYDMSRRPATIEPAPKRRAGQFSAQDKKQLAHLRQFACDLMAAQEQERQKISRELHDDMGNRIALMSLSIRQIFNELSEPNDKTASSILAELDKISNGIVDLSTRIRNLSNSLYPSALGYLGIRAGLKALRYEYLKAQTLDLELVFPREVPRLSENVDLCLYRIVEEYIHETTKLFGADRIRIELTQSLKHVRLTMSHNGKASAGRRLTPNVRRGLIGIEERTRWLGGTLRVGSAHLKRPQVTLTIPIQAGVE